MSLRGVCTWCLPTELWLPSGTQDHTLLSLSLRIIGIGTLRYGGSDSGFGGNGDAHQVEVVGH